MNSSQIFEQIRNKQSYLCVGLDTDIEKIPRHLLASEDPVFEFNRQIIDATSQYCVAYKPNIAFYEALGPRGWESLRKTLDYIPCDIFTIADAKRGDIGATAKQYAIEAFERYQADSVTLSPYMGSDSVQPYHAYPDRGLFLLCRTSNPGSTKERLRTPPISRRSASLTSAG